jgi:hypothetical protein
MPLLLVAILGQKLDDAGGRVVVGQLKQLALYLQWQMLPAAVKRWPH